MTRVWDIPVHDSTRVSDVRAAADAAAADAGFSELRRASAALVATELATNLLRYGGGGRVLIETLPHPAADAPREVQILCVDHGPGIPDLHLALRDGYSSTGDSLGAGLGTCRRTADVFDVHSVPGRGTVALARLSRVPPERHGTRPADLRPVRAGGVHVPLPGLEHSGDAWSQRSDGGVLDVLVADGLGHGLKAADASDAAVRHFHGRPPGGTPETVLRGMDGALRATRGAAIAVVRVDPAAGRLEFAGLGNIGARIYSGGRWQHLMSRPGIVGVHRPSRYAAVTHPWTADTVLVLHSDGLPSRWQYLGDPVADHHDPATLAAVILRDASSQARLSPDDTTIAVVTAVPAQQERV
jgi:anti-sigma regulatory factor (Ser/Thr protein kinase)